MNVDEDLSFPEFEKLASKDSRFSGGRQGEGLFREYKLELKAKERKKRKLETEKQEKQESKKKKMLEDLNNLELAMKKTLVGQRPAIEAVSNALRVRDSGWMIEPSPLVFLFLGPSGTGKTELAKLVSEYLKKDQQSAFIRIDMSEYQEKHGVAKLIGSPPGYVGHKDGGQLTKKLRENPEAVVLLDEVDKAHPDVLTVLLQLFDEGRLTDGEGKTIECKNAIFIMTANIASREISEVEGGEVTDDVMRMTILPAVTRHFQRPEFVGRISETVCFLQFTEDEVKELVERELSGLAEQGGANLGAALTWSDEVLEVLVGGYNDQHGVRSIKNKIKRDVLPVLVTRGRPGNIKLVITDGKIHAEVSSRVLSVCVMLTTNW